MLIKWPSVQAGNRLEVPSDVPDAFQSLITSAWAQDPDQRPTCLELMKTIKEIQTSPPVSNYELMPPATKGHPTPPPSECRTSNSIVSSPSNDSNVKHTLDEIFHLNTNDSIPKLFIVLPDLEYTYNSKNIWNNNYRVYFVCECNEHVLHLTNHK
ncbi:unnamed protein product [Didymodactylos carnosus]|uniref:Serine-threonine/tyrosine-protein kinase catalytic domain-containing protein n=1 Tax=Didymodactylos carnosus TaxID=1234261 RepID=A0A8S2NFM8_9BILA|nr:unnamed protein product [Didymodactylos carnosus]CAF3998790.1 unnamed protein product [Didymodactylos carnosus]